MSERQGFLQRWSKRKIEEKSEAAAKSASLTTAEVAPPDPAEPGYSPPEVVADSAEPDVPFDVSTLPSIEDITGDSNLSMFLQKGVPEALKNAAMRKVWVSDPFFRDATGPVDYAWDFNDLDSIPGFGTLPADFDVAGMVRKIMGDVEPQSASTSAEPVVEQVRTSADLVASQDVQAPAADVASGETESAIKDDEPGNEKQDEIPLSDRIGDNSAVSDALLAETHSSDGASVPSRKRHGGALPY